MFNIKTPLFNDVLIFSFVWSFVIASLLNFTMLPLVAIIGGIIGGVFCARMMYRKRWAAIPTTDAPIWMRYLAMVTWSAIASQIGWAALLV